jgi:hypothetical protein
VTRRPPRVPPTRANTLFLLPVIPDDAPSAFKNALAVRNACMTEGRCPYCKTIGEIHADAEFEGIYHYVFRHEAWCVVLADGDAA